MVGRREQAVQNLRRLADEIPAMMQEVGTKRFQKWRRDTMVAIRIAFGGDSEHVDEFKRIRFDPMLVISDTERTFQRAHVHGLETAAAILGSMLEEIDSYGTAEEAEAESQATRMHTEKPQSNRVFVVHGRDDAAKSETARFLERLDLEPVILGEQSSGGATIVEKIEQNADVGFAVALLTPDDEGHLLPDGEMRPRARQNVVLELGYFMGKLGRGRVRALLKGDVEKPSDIDGVVYIRMDDPGSWKLELVRELKHANYDVDANKIV